MEKSRGTNIDINVLELIWNNTNDAIFTIGYDGRLTSLNPAYTAILGWEMEDFTDDNPFPYFINYSKEKHHQQLEQFKQGHNIPFKVTKRKRKDGTLVDVVASYRTINDGEVLAVGMYKDFSEQLKIQQKLQHSEDRYRNLIEHLPVAILIEKKEKIIYVNPAAVQLSGAQSAEEIIGLPICSFIQNEDYKVLRQKMDVMLHTGESIIESFKRIDGQLIWIEMMLISTDEEEATVKLLLKDITDKKSYEEKLKYLAFHDPLTGLTNRRYFTDLINAAIEQAMQQNEKMAVLYLDIDQFKGINDTLGHDVGDQLIVQFAERLKLSVRKKDILCRVGGDEFLVLIENIANREEIENLVERMHQAFQQPYSIKDQEVKATASFGIALFPENGRNSKKLITLADQALYKAKEQRNRYQFY